MNLQKKNLPIIFLFLLVFFLNSAFAQEILLESFDDGNYNDKPSWWTFDDIVLQVIPSDKDTPLGVGKYWLKITGTAKNWYVGGFGTSFKLDATKYNAIQFSVFGNGPRSGRLKVELYDDDNNNEEIEQDEAKNYAPIYDDRFVYEKKIDWHGWKTVTIPFSDFFDDNSGVGDDKWNPDQKSGSGGLMNIQFILIATSKTGSVDIGIDNIKLVKISEQK